ncbi:MAG: hypothetical protein ACT4PX_11880 [Actinomycetota bacterium]
MDLNKLTQGEKVVGAAGVALLVDLLFLPWHSIDLGILSVTRSAVESPNGFWGILALLVTIAMVAAVVVTRFTTTRLPDLPVPLGQAMWIAGIAVAGLLLLKLVAETDALGFGAWFGLLLGGAVAYGGYLMRREAGPLSGQPPTDLSA